MEAPDIPDTRSPLGLKKGTRRIWKHQDVEEFQVPDASFINPDVVKTFFSTNISLATPICTWELRDPVKTKIS